VERQRELHDVKAVYINASGGQEILIYGDGPDPEAGPGEVGSACAPQPTIARISASVREAGPRDVYPGFLPSTSRWKWRTSAQGWKVGRRGARAAVWDERLNSLKPGGWLMNTGVTSWPHIPFNLSILQGVQ
jgi:hypothetical protein